METKMIGIKITEARKKINISQAQLAERLFISAQAVGKWERGESLPDIITLNRLAEILGVDLNYFSENFRSANTENTSVDSLSKQSSESALESKPKKKLNWDMSRGNWISADFSGLKNLHEKFSSSNMQSCKFVGSDLSGLLLKSNNVDHCDFSESNMNSSQIQYSHIVSNLFKDCVLKEAVFLASHIKGCDFSGADFTGATFKNSSFLKNKIVNAVLKRSTWIGSHIADIVFEGTVEDCSFDNCSFPGVIFRNTTLTNTFFKCKSLKRIKFIDCKADRMTYEFLKNGKADLTGIELLTS